VEGFSDDDRVSRSVVERDRLGRSVHDVDARKIGSDPRSHRRSRFDCDRATYARVQQGRELTCAGREIEHGALVSETEG